MINFIVISAGHWPTNAAPSCCYLKSDNWDDYHFKTLFKLLVVADDGTRHEVGEVKIMTKGMTPGRVDVPGQFTSLDSNYCSLGQGQDYYEQIFSLPLELRTKVLDGLKDCVANPSIWEEFQDEKAMEISLLRSVDQFSVLNTFRNILLGIAAPTAYRFRFVANIEADSPPFSVDISVAPGSMPPTNVHVLIGRNGVGKTRLLAGLSSALTSTTDADSVGIQGSVEFLTSPFLAGPFPTGKFANLVAVAFSAFDRFAPIRTAKVSGDMRYTYVGLKREGTSDSSAASDLKSPSELNREFAESLALSLSGPRHQRWVQTVQILNADPGFAELELDALNPTSAEELSHAVATFDRLSSGHRIVLLTAAKLVELVDERTLVLIDEPESHLHPPLLGSLMRALSNLLTMRNGVAIVATHSPVVLQEVPRDCVWVMRRTGRILSAERPSIQTFGENVGVLTREVFQLEVTESGFHKLLQDAVISRDYDEVIGMFGNQIGAEGRAIVRAMALQKKG